MSINFDVFNKRELQNFKAMLNLAEAEGVVDIRFVRQRIEEHLVGERRKTYTKKTKGTGDQQLKACPHCGTKMHTGKMMEGVTYNGCPKCYYSEVV